MLKYCLPHVPYSFIAQCGPSLASNAYTVLHSTELKQQKPMRRGALPDLMFTNEKRLVEGVKVKVILGFSDHQMLMPSKTTRSCTVGIKLYTRENVSLLLNGAGDPVTQDMVKAEVWMPPLP